MRGPRMTDAARAALAEVLADPDPEFVRRVRERIAEWRPVLDRLGGAPVNTGRLSDER